MVVKKYVIDRRPTVWWYVTGRQQFDSKVPYKIRQMWKIGNYVNPKSRFGNVIA